MSAAEQYLAELDAAACAAGAAEDGFRREAARRSAELERARAFAFRRYNLVKDLAAAMRACAEEDAAVAAGLARLRQRFGWPAGADGPHGPVLDAFRPVAAALHLAARADEPTEPADPAGALADFERWFEARGGRSFWSLLDQPATETPVVDF